MLQKKLDRAMEWLKNRSVSDDPLEEKLELEGKDIIAIIISALIVFLPILFVLLLILFWVAT
jgi:hypothetical protein